MSVFRDIKRSARQDLHLHLSVPAVLVTSGADPFLCTVRIQNSFAALGDLKGTSFHYAEREEISPKAIFLRSEVPNPKRGDIISVEVGEAYRIDSVLPPDDITVAANILRLTGDSLTGLPVPGDV